MTDHTSHDRPGKSNDQLADTHVEATSEEFSQGLAKTALRPYPDALAEAEKTINKLADEYLHWVQNNVDGISDKLNAAHNNPRSSAYVLDSIADIAKGLSSTGHGFGYALITTIADSLHHYSCNTTQFDFDNIEIIAAHIRALRFVREQNMQGHGGLTGRRLTARLHDAVEKSLTG